MGQASDQQEQRPSRAQLRLRFVIVGTGRCGTGYVAQLLSGCGLPTGHEAVYGPWGPSSGAPGLLGDSSWLAVPYPTAGSTTIVHVVRDPLAVVRSLVGIRFFGDPVHGPYRDFAFRHLPDLPHDDELAAAVRWVVEWNKRCDQLVGSDSRRRVRVEDLTTMQAVKRLGELVGHTLSDDAVQAALSVVPTDYNARPRAPIDWQDIPDDTWGRRFRKLGQVYGYQTA